MPRDLILVVEDNRHTARRIRRVLQDGGYLNVRCATVGRHALALAERIRPSLVLLDAAAADQRALEIASGLKQNGQLCPRILGLLSGGSAPAAALETLLDDRVDDPFNPDLLLARVTTALQHQRWDLDRSDRLKELRVLEELGRLQGSSARLDTLLEMVVAEVTKLPGVDFTAVSLADRESITWAVGNGQGLPPPNESAILESDVRAITRARLADPSAETDAAEIIPVGWLRGGVRAAARRLGINTLVRLRLTKGGETIGLLIAGRATADPHTRRQIARLNHVAGIASVIVERDRLRDELRQLDRRVERLEELIRRTDHQLREAASLTTMGMLTSSLIHDFLQPLTAALGMLEMLVDAERLSAKGRSLAERTDRVLRRVAETADRFRRIARPVELDVSAVDILQVVEDALSLVEQDLRLGQVEVVRAYQPDLPPVRGNAEALERVFVNLLSNARDAMAGRPGTVTITAVTVAAAEGVEHVAVVIRDQGRGILESVRDHIFEPLFTTKGSDQGLGLGLNISQEIVQRHDGTISVESAEGQGTSFRVVLPAYRPETASSES